MVTSLATQISTAELAPRAAISRSFLVVEGGKPEPTELYRRTQDIHDLVGQEQGHGSIGYPTFVIDRIAGIAKATISTGVEGDAATPFWQINVGNNGEHYTIQGRISEEGEEWGLISADHQGRLRQEATIEDDSPGELAAFVLGAINQVPLDEVVARLIQEKKITAAQYESYLAGLQPIDRYGFSGNNLSQIYGSFATTGFTGVRANTLQHVIVSAPGRRTVEQLPVIVRRLLRSINHEVTVPVSKPKVLKNSLFI